MQTGWRHKPSILVLALGLLCSLLFVGSVLAQSGGDYDVEWNVIGAAGDEFPSGGGYQVGFTLGQPSPPWIPSGGGYQSVNGYWSGGGFSPFIPALEAGKWVTPDLEVAYHAEVTYTVKMTNTGPVGAAVVLLTDTLPTEVDFVRWVSQNGASYASGPPEQITWNGPIAAGNSVTWSWVVRHAVDYGGAVTNTAQFGCSDTGQTGSAGAVFALDSIPPDPPRLVHPPDGRYTNTTAITLDWDASSSPDATGYWVDWNGARMDLGNVTEYAPGVLADGTYTWTVAAYDDLGNTTGYTDVWSFAVDATLPASPTLLSPANGTVTSDTTPVLSWDLSPSPDAIGYLVDLQGNVTDVGDTTAYTPSALVDGVYTWTVGVYDLATNVAYTETWTIRVDTVAPQIIGTVPTDEAEDAPAGQPLVITFDDAINPLSFVCVVQPDPGGWATAWSPDGMVVTLTHSAFAVETRYTATVASARDLAGNPMAGPYEWSFTTGSYMYYLPLIQRSYSSMPDLVVDIVEASSNTVTVVVANRGNQTVTDDFWIDVYFNPRVRPPRINQPWRTIAAHGVTWGVTLDLPPDAPLILTNDVADPFYFPQESSPPPLPVGQDVYAYVDSVNFATTYGAVLERDETNNIDGPAASIAGTGADRLSRGEGSKLKPEDTDDLPPRR